jgi:hypothetical protein
MAEESIIGGVWAAVFHHVSARFSLDARFETNEPFVYSIFFLGPQ